MYLNTSVIYEHLSDHYTLSEQHEFLNPTLYSARIYTGDIPESNHIYILRPDQLAFLSYHDPDVVYICPGIDPALQLTFKQDIILIKESVDRIDLLNQLNHIYDYYNHWESRLNECSYDYDGIQKMLNRSRSFLNGTLILADYYFNLVAYTKDFLRFSDYIDTKQHGKTPTTIIQTLLSDPVYHEIQTLHDVFVYVGNEPNNGPSLCYNLFRQNETLYYGRLMLISENFEYTQKHYFLLKYLGDKINRIFEQFSVFSLPTPIYTNLREVIYNSITQQVTVESLIISILKEVRWNLNDEYVLIHLTNSIANTKNPIHEMVCNQLELLFPESCAILHQGIAILLINLTQGKISDRILREKLAVFLRENLFKAGISNHFSSFLNIRFAHEEAAVALRIGNIKNHMFWYYNFNDYMLDYIVEQSSLKLPSKNLCHQGLVKLLNYDKENETNYYEALRIFIEKKYNVTHTADALFIHRTTFLKYLEKILQVTELDLNDWNTRLHLMLSYQYLDH